MNQIPDALISFRNFFLSDFGYFFVLFFLSFSFSITFVTFQEVIVFIISSPKKIPCLTVNNLARSVTQDCTGGGRHLLWNNTLVQTPDIQGI